MPPTCQGLGQSSGCSAEGGDRDVPRDRAHQLPCWAWPCCLPSPVGVTRDQGGLFLGLPLPPSDPFHTSDLRLIQMVHLDWCRERLPVPPQRAQQSQGQCSPAHLGQAIHELSCQFSASAGQGWRRTLVSSCFILQADFVLTTSTLCVRCVFLFCFV